MNWLDIALLVVIGIAVWRGFVTGGVTQVLGLAGWFVALIVAALFMQPFGQVVADSLGVSEAVGPILGFVCLFAVVLVTTTLIARALRKILEAIKLGVADSALGGAFGGLKAALGASLVLAATAAIPLPNDQSFLIGRETREESVLYEPVRAVAPLAWSLFQTVLPGVQRELFEIQSEIQRDAATEASQ